MSEFEDAVKWAKETFPLVVGNDELVLNLYRARVLGKSFKSLNGSMSFPYRQLEELEERKPAVTVAVVVGDLEEMSYFYCKKCGKGRCLIVEHEEFKEKRYRYQFTATDSTRAIRTVAFDLDRNKIPAIKEGANLLLKGSLNKNQYGETFVITDLKLLSLETAKAFVDFKKFFYLSGGDSVGVDGTKFREYVKTAGDDLQILIDQIAFNETEGRVTW